MDANISTLDLTALNETARRESFWRLIKHLSSIPVKNAKRSRTKEGEFTLTFTFVGSSKYLMVFCREMEDGSTENNFRIRIVNNEIQYDRISGVEGLGPYESWFYDLLQLYKLSIVNSDRYVDHGVPGAAPVVMTFVETVASDTDTSAVAPLIHNDNNATPTAGVDAATVLAGVVAPAEAVETAKPARTDSEIQREAALEAVATVLSSISETYTPHLKQFFESAGLSIACETLFGNVTLTLASESFFGGPAFSYQFSRPSDWDESLDEFMTHITK